VSESNGNTPAVVTKEYTVASVPIETIKAAEFNPMRRTDPATLKSKSGHLAILKASIDRYGLLYPLLIGNDGVLGDGHRRLSVVRQLGWTHVPVHFVNIPAAVIWAQDAEAKLATNNRDWWAATALGMPIESVPVRVGRRLADLYRWLGPEDYVDMAFKRSTDVHRTVTSIARYVKDDSNEFARLCVLWIDRWNGQLLLDDARKKQVSPTVLYNAILENRQLRMTYEAI